MKFNNNSKDIRLKIREGSFSSTTSGLNPGFTQTNDKQWFHGAKVPKREWFGIPKSMFPVLHLFCQ